jgi:hypothetical protein
MNNNGIMNIKSLITSVAILSSFSIALSQTAFTGAQTTGGDYVLNESVSLTGGNDSYGHWVNGGNTMTITGTSDSAKITGSRPFWITNSQASLTTLNLVDVSLENIVSVVSANNAASVATASTNGLISISAVNYDVNIKNNTTPRFGGAIILNNSATLNLSANGKDISFTGNGGTGPGKAIYVDATGATLNFTAKAGNAIIFSDVINMNAGSATTGAVNIGDSSGNFNGKVSFLSTSVNSLYNVTLSSGTLELVLTSNTSSNLTMNVLDYIAGDFNLLIANEGSYSFTLASAITGSGALDASKFNLPAGFDMKDFTLSGGLVSFTAVAVPEPGTYAAILGVLALAFAAYGKRNDLHV